MIISVEDLKKALTKVEKTGSIGTVEIEIDSMNRLVIKFTEPMGEDQCAITIYSESLKLMPKITTTSRL